MEWLNDEIIQNVRDVSNNTNYTNVTSINITTGTNDEINEQISNLNSMLSAFFWLLFWNSMMCIPTIKGISGLIRGECNEYVTNLFCSCFCVVAFVVPIALAKQLAHDFPPITFLIIFFITYVLPYSIGVLLELRVCCFLYRGERRCCCPHLPLLKELFFGIPTRAEYLHDEIQSELDPEDAKNIRMELMSTPDRMVNVGGDKWMTITTNSAEI
mmetsp:Transcript_35047/g.52297  ORF Transcript_35047/g.52297 Transcript_35047/m.52297 type:complete len:214 (+) Transcript_35047:22-663(+)